MPDQLLSIPGYSILRYNRVHKKGGGIIAYIKNNLNFRELTPPQSTSVIESIWVKISLERLPRNLSPLLLGCFYHPPGNNDQEFLQHLSDSLDSFRLAYPSPAIVLMGDFNRLKDSTLKRDFSLKQIVSQATRGNAILDCIYTNLDQFYKEPEILPPLLSSDHLVVLAEPMAPHLIPRPPPKRIMKRSYPSSHKTLFAHAIAAVDWTQLYTLSSCQEKYQEFTNVIRTMIEGFFPLKQVTVCDTDKPWVTPRFKEHISKRQQYLKQGNKVMYNFFRNIVNREAKSLRRNYFNNQVQELKQTNSRKWWGAMRNFLGSDNKSSSMIRLQQQLGTDTPGLAAAINAFFESVSSDMSPLRPLPDDILDQQTPDEFLLTVKEVEQSLCSLDTRKSSGPDSIPTWVLRDFCVVLAPPVCHLFNTSLLEGYVPDVWKSADVVPIPKVPNPSNIRSDLRPISLTPVQSVWKRLYANGL